MNYKKHYSLLIERAKDRSTVEYTEMHHILPRCIGGDDDRDNLVRLYPEEHFLAHQLLVKMNPDNPKLAKAALMMCAGTALQERSNNKIYGWLRKRFSKAMSESQTGTKNTQHGTCWISNLDLKECKKIQLTELDEYIEKGWVRKRIINWSNHILKVCPMCGEEFTGSHNTCSVRCGTRLSLKNNPREFAPKKLESMIEDYKKGNSVYRCLINAGMDGTGRNHTHLSAIVKDL